MGKQTQNFVRQKVEDIARNKTYAEVVSSRMEEMSQNQTKRQYASVQEKDRQEWTVVRNKRTIKKVRMESKTLHTIFLHNIPDKVSAKDMWDCLRNTGEVLDIILPRKRDKKNKRYGFVKTTSELEAGKIILNAKEKGGVAACIRMSINTLSKNDKGKASTGKLLFQPI